MGQNINYRECNCFEWMDSKVSIWIYDVINELLIQNKKFEDKLMELRKIERADCIIDEMKVLSEYVKKVERIYIKEERIREMIFIILFILIYLYLFKLF